MTDTALHILSTTHTDGRRCTIFAALTDAELATYEAGNVVLDPVRIMHLVIGREPSAEDVQAANEAFRQQSVATWSPSSRKTGVRSAKRPACS